MSSITSKLADEIALRGSLENYIAFTDVEYRLWKEHSSLVDREYKRQVNQKMGIKPYNRPSPDYID